MARGASQHRFFYLLLLAGKKLGQASNCDISGLTHDGISYLIGAYGVHKFLADIDNRRNFRDQNSIIAAAFSFASGEGFREIFFDEDKGFKFKNVVEFRERNQTYQMQLTLVELAKMLAPKGF
jgi:hypothetical protein